MALVCKRIYCDQNIRCEGHWYVCQNSRTEICALTQERLMVPLQSDLYMYYNIWRCNQTLLMARATSTKIRRAQTVRMSKAMCSLSNKHLLSIQRVVASWNYTFRKINNLQNRIKNYSNSQANEKIEAKKSNHLMSVCIFSSNFKKNTRKILLLVS